jgi:hypothetical protein
MNWVERRATRERNLDTGAPKVWDEVRGAIQDACESFNQHYPQPNRDNSAECKLENGRRVRVRRIILADMTTVYHPQDLQVIVMFEKDVPSITATFPAGSLIFYFEADEEGAFVAVAGKRLTPDEISEKILGPVLFPPEVKTRAASIPKRPEGGV